jgi:hypothetical protein
VLHKKLEDAWQARCRAMPISAVLKFAPEGLVLGAGTVVVAAEGGRQLDSLAGQEAHVLALLSAAYGKAVPPSVIGNIKRAAKAWSEGDDCLAYVHLAHARLPMPDDPYEAAYRLFVVDGFMKSGAGPRAVFEAHRLSPQYVDAVEKAFNPDEPRVPAGSGRTSGRWTRGPDGSEQPAGGPEGPANADGRELSFRGPIWRSCFHHPYSLMNLRFFLPGRRLRIFRAARPSRQAGMGMARRAGQKPGRSGRRLVQSADRRKPPSRYAAQAA